MRFFLFESDKENAELDITPYLINQFNNGDTRQRDLIVRKILNKMHDTGVNNLRNSFRKSCFDFGIDSNKNPFIMLIPMLSELANVDGKHDAHVCALIDLVQQGFVDKQKLQKIADRNRADKNGYLLDKSLYHRNVKDFIYTVKAFEIALDPRKLSRYYSDIERISAKDLYDKSGRIKPAGSPETANDTGTIFGTIESWGGNDGSNNKRIRRRNRDDDNELKLTDIQKRRIKDYSSKRGISHLDDVKDPEDGMRVFVWGQTKPRRYAIDTNNPDAGYYQYTRNGWKKIAEV